LQEISYTSRSKLNSKAENIEKEVIKVLTNPSFRGTSKMINAPEKSSGKRKNRMISGK